MNIYRRNRSTELFLIVVVSVFLLYGYYSMQDLRNKLNEKDKQTDKTHHYAKLLREQLKVLYKHTGKLEQALKDEKNVHKNTKQELLDKVEEFHLNATKTKHEAVNRFNALDTDYKMLKANYEETYQNYAVLQQQHVRLNEAHKNLISSSKADCDRMKFSIENETLHLHSRIQFLYRDNMETHQLAEQYYTYYQDALNQVKTSTDIAREYKEQMEQYGQKHRFTLDQLNSCMRGENVSRQLTNDDVQLNGTNEERSEMHDETTLTTTTERPKLRNIVAAKNAWPVAKKRLESNSHAVLPLNKPIESEEILSKEAERSMNNEDERERSGANIELNDLLEHKSLYMPLSPRDNQMKRKHEIQGNVDNRDIREITLENDEELSQNFLTSNSSPA